MAWGTKYLGTSRTRELGTLGASSKCWPARATTPGYNVKYDDGDSESNVATACLALVQSAEEDAAMRRGKGAGTKRKAPVDSGSNNGQKKQHKG